MLFRMLYNDRLAQASYFVGCQAHGEALVIDPNRDLDQYIKLAEQEGFRITAVTETHIHADFLSGARELAARTGATLYLSNEGDDSWKYSYAKDDGAMLVHDGATFKVGDITIEVIHTPGHTPEHIAFMLTDAGADRPMGIFTGDFVFVGDVGRPDLLETAAGVTGSMEQSALQLYGSLQRFKRRHDYKQVWPGHGAGSACGKALSAVPQSTIGYEKLYNWALLAKSEDEFVAQVLEGQPEPPFYFAEMKRLNKEGPAPVSNLPQPNRLASDDIGKWLDEGLLVIDTRSNEAFAGGHIPGTINIARTKSYLTWYGWLVAYDKPYALIVDEAFLDETVADLRLIALDHLAGYWTPDVIDAWRADGNELQQIVTVDAEHVEQRGQQEAVIVDVRGSAEYTEGHIPGALSVPLGYLSQRLAEIPENQPIIVHCQTGVRSAIAASVLQRLGRTDVSNYAASFEDWVESGRPIDRTKAVAHVGD